MLFLRSYHTLCILRLGLVPRTVRFMAGHGYKSNQQLVWDQKVPDPIAPMYRQLESWSDMSAIWQAVRVMVKHVYVDPSQLSYVVYPQVRLGQVPRMVRVMARHSYKSNQQLVLGPEGPRPKIPTLQAVRVMVRHGQAVKVSGLGQSNIKVFTRNSSFSPDY